jgi:hypothetical protein
MKFLKVLLFILLFPWELVQNIFAIVFILLNKKYIISVEWYKLSIFVRLKKYIIAGKHRSGNALGRFIILPEATLDYDRFVIDHENGHTLQSLCLGPIYPFLIMIFSFINYNREIKDKEFHKRYYSTFPENWADLWGGVKNRKVDF